MKIRTSIGKFKNIIIDIPVSNGDYPWELKHLITVRRNEDNDPEICSTASQEILDAIKANSKFLTRLSQRTGITEEELVLAVKRLIMRVINNSSIFYYGPADDHVYIKGYDPTDKIDDLRELARYVDLTCAGGDNMFKKGILKKNHTWADIYLNIPFRRFMSLNRFPLMRGIDKSLEFINPESPVVIDQDQIDINLIKTVNIFRIRGNIPGTEEGACIISKSCAKKLRAVKKYCTTKDPGFIAPTKVTKTTLISSQEVEVFKGERIWDFRIGDKIIDAHSNKSIASLIVPDEEMPLINGKRVEMIFNPNIEKRCNFSTVIEERLSNCSGPYPIICTNPEAVLNCPSNVTYVTFRGKEYRVSYGTTKFYRPDQIAAEKFQITNLTLGDAWLKFYCGNKELLKKIMARTDQDVSLDLLNQTFKALRMVKKTNSIEYDPKYNPSVGPEYYLITKKLDRTKISTGFDEPQNETVLDPITTMMHSYVVVGKTNIIMPARPFTVIDGKIIVDPIRAAFNRIIAELQSIQKRNLVRYVNEYKSTLEKSLKGKNGAIYNTVYPRIPCIYGVAYNADIAEDEILLPRGVTSEEYATVIRMPVHGIHNVKLLKVRNTDGPAKAIGINYKTMKSMDGDFDGDCLTVIPHPKDEAELLLREQKYNSYVDIESKVDIDKTPFMRGLTDDEIIDGQIVAAKRFYNIKRLTAMGAAIAIKIRDNALSEQLNLDAFHLYGRIYHYIAQAALNEKHNNSNQMSPVEKLVVSYPRNRQQVIKAIHELFQGDTEAEKAFISEMNRPAKLTLLQAIKFKDDLRTKPIIIDELAKLIYGGDA